MLVAALFAPAHTFADDMADIKADAKALTAEGQRLVGGERFLEASAKFREAYALVPHPTLLYNLGISHRLAGNRFTSRSYYRKYLAVQSEGELADLARKFIAELDLSISEDPAPDPIPETKAKAPDNSVPPATTDTPTQGSNSDGNGSVSGAVEPTETQSRRRMTTTTWALSGVSLVSLGIGSYFAIAGYSDYSDCDSRGTCETDQEVDDIDSKLLLGDVFLGVSVVSAVAAGVLYWLSDEEVPPLGVTTTESSAAVHYRIDF